MPKKDEADTSAFDALDAALEADAGEDAAPEQRLHAFLSDEDVLEARKRAREKLDKERRANAMKRIEAEELERLRLEEGLTTGDRVKDEIVDIVIDLAPHSDKLVVNGQAYHQGFTYPVARHVADTLREMMARGWAHQDEIDGKNKTQIHLQNRQFKLMQKGKAEMTPTSVKVGAGGVSGAVPKNLGLKAGPETHANV